MISVLCKSESTIIKHPDIYANFILVLQAQLLEIPEDFLVDIVSSNNFIYHHLRLLFRNVSNDIDERLKEKFKKFQEKLTIEFGWDFSDVDLEDDDELPVVVQLWIYIQFIQPFLGDSHLQRFDCNCSESGLKQKHNWISNCLNLQKENFESQSRFNSGFVNIFCNILLLLLLFNNKCKFYYLMQLFFDITSFFT